MTSAGLQGDDVVEEDDIRRERADVLGLAADRADRSIIGGR